MDQFLGKGCSVHPAGLGMLKAIPGEIQYSVSGLFQLQSWRTRPSSKNREIDTTNRKNTPVNSIVCGILLYKADPGHYMVWRPLNW
jgi:hypothetical protein